MGKVLHTFKCVECDHVQQGFYEIMGEIPQEIECTECKGKARKQFGTDFGLRGGGWYKDGYQKAGAK
mgnify:FL=1